MLPSRSHLWLFLDALPYNLQIHNFPEGFAVAMTAYAEGAELDGTSDSQGQTLNGGVCSDALIMTIGIALHNIPEVGVFFFKKKRTNEYLFGEDKHDSHRDGMLIKSSSYFFKKSFYWPSLFPRNRE